MSIIRLCCRVFIVAAFAYSATAYAAKDCESWSDGYTIQSIIENGWTIKLSDGTIWRVDEKDIPLANLWKPGDAIEICNGDRLTDTRDAATIHAKQVQ